MSRTIKDRDVFPGDKLAVIEVLQDGTGAYEIDGDIRATVLGRAHFDLKNRKVEVDKKTRELILPREGLDVVAEVGSVMRRDARVDIFMIEGKVLGTPFNGEIHVSSVERKFSKDMGMAMRNGDIIKAKVTNTKNRMVLLTVKGPEYGVIYAYCTRCGTLLELQRGRLHCSRCDRTERRKIAATYGREELV